MKDRKIYGVLSKHCLPVLPAHGMTFKTMTFSRLLSEMGLIVRQKTWRPKSSLIGVKASMTTHGTTSPYIILSLVAPANEANVTVEAIEAIGAIEAI